jgi:hypothetical protein
MEAQVLGTAERLIYIVRADVLGPAYDSGAVRAVALADRSIIVEALVEPKLNS